MICYTCQISNYTNCNFTYLIPINKSGDSLMERLAYNSLAHTNINILRPNQNVRNFVDDNFQINFLIYKLSYIDTNFT